MVTSQYEWKILEWDEKLQTNKLLRGTHTFQAKGSKTLSGQYNFLDQQFDLNFWPCDLKISRKHLLCRGIHSTKFGYFQAKGSKDIERKSLGIQTDRSTVAKRYAPFFQMGGGGTKLRKGVAVSVTITHTCFYEWFTGGLWPRCDTHTGHRTILEECTHAVAVGHTWQFPKISGQI